MQVTYPLMATLIRGKETRNGHGCECKLCPTRSLAVLTLLSYAEAPEIHRYFKGCAEKWGCMEYIKLGHRVIGAKWSEMDSKWDVVIEEIETGNKIYDRCDVLLSATGVLKVSVRS